MYNNYLSPAEELEEAFTHSEILYLISYRNNNNNKSINYIDIINGIEKLVHEYNNNNNSNINNVNASPKINHTVLKEISLNLWYYCMGWTKYNENDDNNNNLLKLIDLNCTALFKYLIDNYRMEILMSLLKICLLEHQQSIDDISRDTQGIIIFNKLLSSPSSSSSDIISKFWLTLSILNICMNIILCISWSQRNSKLIQNNPLFISSFHINNEPLFVHLFNYCAQDNYCERMPIKKFIIYIKWHLLFTNRNNNKLNDIINTLKKRNKFIKKSNYNEFQRIANDIDYNYTPVLILPPSINNMPSDGNDNDNSGGGVAAAGMKQQISNAANIFKSSLTELFNNNNDNKNDDNDVLIYQRPHYIDYRYPVHNLSSMKRFQFEAISPRCEIFGKQIIPNDLLNLFENAYSNLPNRLIKKYNMYSCDIYRYICVKAHIPEWIRMKQIQNNKLNNNNNNDNIDKSPKWLQNIRMGLAIKMFIKLLISCMPSSYIIDNNTSAISMRVNNIPDIRYEIVNNLYNNNNNNNLNYIIELRRHQDILGSNLLHILLSLLKLFKTHERLQFEYLRYLITKHNGILILLKLFNHPLMNDYKYKNNENNKILITKPSTYIKYNSHNQLINIIYNNDCIMLSNNSTNSSSNNRLVTIKINCLRIIQKCIKYSYGHCKFLVDVLNCNEWMIKYINNNNNDNDIQLYYLLKIYKSMMPFINKDFRESNIGIKIIKLIRHNIQIRINDSWLSYNIKIEYLNALKLEKEKEEKPSSLVLDPYYDWLALKPPQEKDYAELKYNPFYSKDDYATPQYNIKTIKQNSKLIDEICSNYHEWLLKQIDLDKIEFNKQKPYYGLTKKEIQKQKYINRSNKVDETLNKIKLPPDFDTNAFLVAYFNGTADDILNKI